MVADEVVHRRGVVAVLGSVEDLDFHLVTGVVEVDDVDVKDEHGGRRDHITWTGNGLTAVFSVTNFRDFYSLGNLKTEFNSQ